MKPLDEARLALMDAEALRQLVTEQSVALEEEITNSKSLDTKLMFANRQTEELTRTNTLLEEELSVTTAELNLLQASSSLVEKERHKLSLMEYRENDLRTQIEAKQDTIDKLLEMAAMFGNQSTGK